MTEFVEAARYGIRNLARFSGRDSRNLFWPYAGAVLTGTGIGTLLVIVPVISNIQTRNEILGDRVPLRIGGYHPELMPDFGSLVGGMSIVFAVAIVLLAAAVTRRLHDIGRRGFWALLPLPFLLAGFRILPELFNGFSGLDAIEGNDQNLYTLLVTNNLFYIVALVLLIIMLSRQGDRRANRYGPSMRAYVEPDEEFGNRPPTEGPSTERAPTKMDRGGNWV